MKKILCPTDFSKTAAKAMEYAALIAKQAGAQLSLLHVVHLPIVDTSETALVASELLGEQMRDAAEKLKNLCQQLEQTHGANQGQGFSCDYILKEALLTDMAQHLTRQEGYDLIVMGTTGGGNTIEELLIGSNAEAVIEEVTCPVLAIPTDAEWPDVHKIVYASAYAPEDRKALQQVVELAEVFGASIDVVHVVKEATPESAAKAESYWQNLQQQFGGYTMRFQEVQNRHRDEGVKQYYKEVGGSIVAVLRKRKGFLREIFTTSLAEKMTYQTEVPLLVLHAPKS